MDKLIVGCGYLGRRVAACWLAQGHQVFGTTRGGPHLQELEQLGVRPVVCDVLEPRGLRALPRADTVLYCVGLDRAAGRGMAEVYVDGLLNVLAALPAPRRFLYVSSTSVYGQEQGEDVDETSATEPAEESGRVVLAAEGVVRTRANLPWVILRFAGLYGPGRVLRRQAIERGDPVVGDGDKWLNLIHVEDGAEAVLAAEARGEPAYIYNVGDDRPVRRREFYGLLARLLGAPEPRFVPGPATDRVNRRIVNRRLRQELAATLRYPTYEQGLPASL